VDIEPTASSGGLPITGANSLALAALALGLVAVGAGALVANRRRTSGDH
jgi:LPXTG-motif cell wall-anchored protein